MASPRDLGLAHESGLDAACIYGASPLRSADEHGDGSIIRPLALTWSFTRSLVLVDEAAEDGPALDPFPGKADGRVVRATSDAPAASQEEAR